MNLESIYDQIRLKLKKQEDQKRFNFLKSLEGKYLQKDFSTLDPLNLQHHSYIQKEQLKWVERMGVGSIQTRFQVEHIELQNALTERFSVKAFFSPLDLDDFHQIIHKWLFPSQAKELIQLFENDPMGLIPLGFEQDFYTNPKKTSSLWHTTKSLSSPSLTPSPPLVKTTFAPFGNFYLVEEPLHSLLQNHSPQHLLPPFLLAGMHTALDLVPTMKREKKELLEKALFLFEEVRKLGFDITLQKFALQISTSKKLSYSSELRELGWHVALYEGGFSLLLRQDHEESTLVQFAQDLKRVCQKKFVIAC
ncbi:MAG: hypothetical protein KGQ54_01690 [Verrucomicrobia bacterium]|nr:hypothetical protein [Verrucomicrobiota bacterium]NDE63167.1 hypothetical protein [Chlamydiota bacterium]